jgi:hypothetical protein
MQSNAFSNTKAIDICHKQTIQTESLQLEEVRRQQCRADFTPEQWLQKEHKHWYDVVGASRFAERLAAKYKRSPRSRFVLAHATFTRLEKRWRQETSAMSLVQDKVSNMAYLQIIGMREDALPFIFQQLQNKRRYWFIALEAITQENPAYNATSFQAAVDAWLSWGQDNGFI